MSYFISTIIRRHYTMILDMDGSLDTEKSAFSPVKQAVEQSILITYFPYAPNNENVQSGISFGSIN